MAQIHLDLDLSRLSFTDTGKRYVEARSGSLVSTTKVGRFTFVGSFGTRSVYIYNRANAPMPGSPQVHNVARLTYYGGVDYMPVRWLDLSITAGQDVEVTQYRGSAELMQFVRVDARFHII